MSTKEGERRQVKTGRTGWGAQWENCIKDAYLHNGGHGGYHYFLAPHHDQLEMGEPRRKHCGRPEPHLSVVPSSPEQRACSHQLGLVHAQALPQSDPQSKPYPC